MGTQFVDTELRGDVLWVFFNNFEKTLAGADADTVDVHTRIGWVMHDARFDPKVRLIVLTGREENEFYSVPPADHYAVQEHRDRVNPLKRPGGFSGHSYPDVIEVLALIEKPVVARVKGDVIGFGQSILWGCDIIVASEDIVVADVHTGMGEVVDSGGVHRGFPQAISPGDGAMAYFSLFLPPTKLKEYMLLSKEYTARDLAAMNIVNYAAPAAEVDGIVDDVVARLLARPDYVLKHTKRLCSKHVINQMNLARDLSAAYEVNDLWQHAKDGTM
ncbi:MAG TPA: enoyl-CoA hydratase/isomerase family protein [Acidimicrobiales bacterium]|jgi:enoyl-CoA hydratase/carnithine racemase